MATGQGLVGGRRAEVEGGTTSIMSLCLEDVSLVLAMPISKMVPSDQVVWHFSNSDEYSVKSGYRTAKSLPLGPESKKFCMEGLQKLFGKWESCSKRPTCR